MKPKGRLIIIGGNEDKEGGDIRMKTVNKSFKSHEILKLIINEPIDRIEVITTATQDPQATEKTYRDTFEELKYTNYGFLDVQEKANPETLERIAKAKTVFLAGGDQSKICGTLKNSAVKELLQQKYAEEDSFTIAGTSAGAMCLSAVMIADAVNGEAMIGYDLDLDEGLGFINSIIDTHFVHRSRFGRLAHAIIRYPEMLGIGLGEDTSLIIEKGCLATVKGSGMVIIMDAKDVRQTNVETVKNACPIYAENLKVDMLTEGCVINVKTGTIDVSSAI